MASKFLRRQKWWVKFRHPVTGESIRESLETGGPARAELLRRRLDLEVALLDPRFQAAQIPARILGALRKTPLSVTEVALFPSEPLDAEDSVQIPPPTTRK